MECRIASTGRLRALIETIRNSPIVVRLRAGFVSASEWARIRKSPEVDAFILAWIASHGRDRRPRRRHFM